MERRIKITTGKQFEIIISELEKRPNLARGFHRGAAHIKSFRQDWEEITIKLNAHGPPFRDSDGWLRVWRDYKFKLRKKLLQKEAEKNGIAEEKTKNTVLFPLEETAAKLIFAGDQLNVANLDIDLLPAVEEIKSESLDQEIWKDEEIELENQSAVEDIKIEDYCMLDRTLLVDDHYMPSTSANFQVQVLASPDRKKRKRNRKIDQRQELLEKHHAMQQEILNEISNTIEELKNVIKDSNQYREKLLEIEEKKLEMVRRQHEREKQLYRSEMDIKIMEMKLKTRELEALEKDSNITD